MVKEKGDECFIRKGFLYIQNSFFLKKLQEKYGTIFTAKQISAYFRDRFISEIYSDNTDKKYGNKRYLVLNKYNLKNDAVKKDGIRNLFF